VVLVWVGPRAPWTALHLGSPWGYRGTSSPYGPRHSLTVGSWEGVVSYERGTPVPIMGVWNDPPSEEEGHPHGAEVAAHGRVVQRRPVGVRPAGE